MSDLIMIFFGGGLGSIARYLLSKSIANQFESLFPWGTFTVNILGCFFIGLFLALIERFRLNTPWGWFFVTGFCGGFTTFSTFSSENVSLVKNSAYFVSLAYTGLSVFWGFAATFLGIFFIKNI